MLAPTSRGPIPRPFPHLAHILHDCCLAPQFSYSIRCGFFSISHPLISCADIIHLIEFALLPSSDCVRSPYRRPSNSSPVGSVPPSRLVIQRPWSLSPIMLTPGPTPCELLVSGRHRKFDFPLCAHPSPKHCCDTVSQ